MKLVGQWFGGSDYGRPHADDFERFSSLRHALVAFEARLNSRRLPFVDVLGPDDGGPEMLLWKLGRDDPDDSRSNSDCPDYRIFCGPRGGVKYEVM